MIGKWLKNLFVFLLVLALPIVYLLGYIGKDWLNRYGIILNFIAGFMVAPELIGIERLRTLEQKLEQWLKTLKEKLSSEKMTAKDLFMGGLFVVLQSAPALILIIVLYPLAKERLAWIIGAIIIFYFLVWLGKELDSGILQLVTFPLILLWMILVELLVSPFFSVILFIIYVITTAIHTLIGFLISNLEGEERLRSIFVWWGILFFIIGNALQFLSTFDMGTVR